MNLSSFSFPKVLRLSIHFCCILLYQYWQNLFRRILLLILMTNIINHRRIFGYLIFLRLFIFWICLRQKSVCLRNLLFLVKIYFSEVELRFSTKSLVFRYTNRQFSHLLEFLNSVQNNSLVLTHIKIIGKLLTFVQSSLWISDQNFIKPFWNIFPKSPKLYFPKCSFYHIRNICIYNSVSVFEVGFYATIRNVYFFGHLHRKSHC